MNSGYDDQGYEYSVLECSNCNKTFVDSDNPDIPEYRFCPHCGKDWRIKTKRKFSVIANGIDFTKGMVCPKCNKHNKFLGGSFGGLITVINYNCECEFSGFLMIPDKGYNIKYQAVKE